MGAGVTTVLFFVTLKKIRAVVKPEEKDAEADKEEKKVEEKEEKEEGNTEHE